MTNLTRIVAAIVDTKKATFYREDGTTVEILQGDLRLRTILEQITDQLEKHGYADVDLSTKNSWQEFEEKANGAVRLYRITKAKLTSFFGTKKEPEAVAPLSMGSIPGQVSRADKAKAAVEEILKHATPVKDPNFTEDKVAPQRPTVESNNATPSDKMYGGRDSHFDRAEDTIIAVTDKNQVVAGVERIKSQFVASGKDGNIKGMKLFLERVAAVTEKRGHTSADLLRFMERGDLPVADDGTIVIYKKLLRTNNPDVYVDVHSKRVTQKVGSYVHMDSSLVDHDRRNECSNGLHVARRGYIHSFSGDVIVLAKVRPEDVIAVPEYDANKMRVCGYHIIAELTPEQYSAINSNRPISHASGGMELLARAISGDHVAVLQRVQIGSAMGGDLTITDLVEGDKPEDTPPEETAVEGNQSTDQPVTPTKKKKVVSKKTKKAIRKVAVKKATKAAAAKKLVKPLEAAVPGKGDEVVDVKAVVKLKAGVVGSLKKDDKPAITQTDVVREMWDAALQGNTAEVRKLLDFKKKAKKGWHTWGLPDTAGDTLKALLD